MEGLRWLGGERADHGPIQVLDGELVPQGALAQAVPDGTRLYEAAGNEGASLELKYRRAVLVVWRRNEASMRMLARCGGRLAIARELSQRLTANKYGHLEEIRTVLDHWRVALETDGGGAEPDAHRLFLGALDTSDVDLRQRYVTEIAAVDLDATAVPSLVTWIRERLRNDAPVDSWVEALRNAFGTWWGHNAASGTPTLLWTLCETTETVPLAIELVAKFRDPPTMVEDVLRYADTVDEILAEEAWRQRRRTRMTSDD